MAVNNCEFHSSKKKEEGEGAIAMNPTLLQFDLKT
jgi:hypothetical protein